MRSIIVGCGQVGRELCKVLTKHQENFVCVVKSSHSHELLYGQGLTAYQIDLDSDISPLEKLQINNKNIYYFAPPDDGDTYDNRIDRFLKFCETHTPSRIVYISTSGVYGDCKGEYVDENTPIAPITDRAKRRTHAENAVIKFCAAHSCKYIILRVGGIYGPERLPINRLNTITVISPHEAPYSNRIHVTDLAKICHTAMHSRINNEIFNVSDGNPSSMTDYYYQIADLAGKSRPRTVPLSQAEEKLSSAMLSFINESRRLSTKKLNQQLNVQLQFPTLTVGLKDCFKKIQAKQL